MRYRQALIDGLMISSLYSVIVTVLMGAADLSAWTLQRRPPKLNLLFYGNIPVLLAVVCTHALSTEAISKSTQASSFAHDTPSEAQVKARVLEEFLLQPPSQDSSAVLADAMKLLVNTDFDSRVFTTAAKEQQSSQAPSAYPPPPAPPPQARTPNKSVVAAEAPSAPADLFTASDPWEGDDEAPDESEFFDQQILEQLTWNKG